MNLRLAASCFTVVAAVCNPGLTRADDLFLLLDRSEQLPADDFEDSKDTLDVDLADIDADGDLDLFVIEGSASTVGFQNLLWINDGLGNFSDETATRLPAIDNNSTEIDLADVDADGDLDAIVANLGANQLLINNGAGVFTERALPQATLLDSPPGFLIAIPPGTPEFFTEVSAEAVFVDVDNDGDPDIVISNENPFPFGGPLGDLNRLLINDGSGRYTEHRERLPNVIDNTSGIAAGDIDADGDTDLIIGNIGQNRVYLNDGRGFFSDETGSRLPVLTDSTRKVVLGDMDGDGDLDLVAGNSRGQQDRLYQNDGTGVFIDVTTSSLPVDEATNTDIDIIDLNGDGALDILVTNVGDFVFNHGFLGEPNRLYLNNGEGRFTDETFPRLPERDGRSSNAELGDVNGDGVVDIVFANSGGIDRPDLPPPDGAERLFIRQNCSLNTELCHQLMLDGLVANVGELRTDSFPDGDMSSQNPAQNEARKRRLEWRTARGQRALDTYQPIRYGIRLWQINLRADGENRPADWVIGDAAERIDGYSQFSLEVLYRYGL